MTSSRKLSPLDRAEIAALKAAGKTSGSIAVLYRTSNAVVRNIFAKALATVLETAAPAGHSRSLPGADGGAHIDMRPRIKGQS